jgi:hypothetical protein
MLWTSIFPFSFAFPLVLPHLLLFLATGICVFPQFVWAWSRILQFWKRFNSPSPLFSSPCATQFSLVHPSVSFFILPVLFFLFSFSSPSLLFPSVLSFSFSPCSFFPCFYFQFCMLCNFISVVWDFFGFSQYSQFASIILCLSASSLISFPLFLLSLDFFLPLLSLSPPLCHGLSLVFMARECHSVASR